MKRKLARFLMTFVLVLCLCFGLTACKKDDDNKDDTPEVSAKVTGLSVSLAEGSSYTLTDGSITIEYSEEISLTGSDFVVTATMSDSTTKTLSPKSDSNPNGYTFKSTIPSDNLIPGNYTLTFGHADLTETAYKTITVKVVAANVNLSTLGLKMTTGLKYNGEEQTATVTNCPLYLDVSYSGNTGTYPNGTTPPAESGVTPSVIPETYTATVTFAVKSGFEDKYILSSEHNTIDLDWKIAKGTIAMPNTDDIMVSYEYEPTVSRTATIKSDVLSDLESKNIHAEITGSTTGTNANAYQVAILFTYTGTDKAYYDFGNKGDGVIGSVDTSWLINPKSIDVSSVALKVKGGEAYSSAFTYDATEKEVEFDLSSINTYLTGENPILSQTSTTNVKATDAGDYTATITFTVNDTNYAVSQGTISLNWKINKADLHVVAKSGQSFVYGSFEASNVEFASSSKGYDGGNSIEFVANESDGNVTELYSTIKNNVTFEVRADDHATTAYTGKLNVGTYYLYPIIPANFTLDNYNVMAAGCVSMQITKKDLHATIKEKTVEFSRNSDYDKSDLDFTLADLVYGDAINDIEITISSVEHKLTSESGGSWGNGASKVGTYEVRINSISSSNYNIIIAGNGTLNIVPLPVEIQESDVSWNINNDNTIIPSYNETTDEWEATIEKTGDVISYEIVIEGNDTIFSKTYTDKSDVALSEIKEAGTYYIKANLSLPSGETRYSFTDCSFTLKLTINQNYFETNTSGGGTEGEPPKTISVVVETTEEDAETGAPQETSENLTFNEFASKTEFKEGDIVKFTLADDPDATKTGPSIDPDEDDGGMDDYGASPTSQIVLYAATRTFVGYKVLYNGQQVAYDITERCYVITLTSSGAGGLVIQRLYKEADSSDEDEPVAVEIFIKSNFKVRVPKPPVQMLNSMKIGETTYTSDNGNYYYKLSENQTEIVVEIDAEYVGKGYYVKLQGDSNDYEFSTSNIVRLPVNSFISSTDLVLSLQNGSNTLVQARVINWVEIKTVDVTYIKLDQSKENIYSEMCLGKTLIGAIGMSTNAPNNIITNIAVTFEEGYGETEGWSYTVTEEDGTPVDYTKVIEYGKDRVFVVNIYKDNVFKYKLRYRYSTDFYYSNTGNTTTSVDTNYDYYVTGSTLSSITLRDENTAVTLITQKFKKSGTSEYDSSVTLDSDLTSVDWKLEIVAGGKTYTFTKTLIVVKENATYNHSWLETEGNLQSLSIKYGNDDNVDCEINEKGLIRINSNSITLDNFKTLYYKTSDDDKGASNWELTIGSTKATKSEYLIMGGFVYLKFTVGGNYIILKLDITGLYDDVVDAEFEIIDTTDFSITKVTTTMQDGEEILEIPTGVELEIYLGNSDASVILTGPDGGDSDYFIFTTPGTYTLLITSVDETKTRTIKLIVTGEEIPMLKIEVEAEEGDDKVYVYDMDTSSEFGEETGDFKLAFDSEHSSYKFYAYAGKEHGLKITTEGSGDNVKRYVTLKDLKSMIFSADSLYDVNGNQITIGNSGVKLEILTDINGNSYFAFYGIMSAGRQSMPYYVYVYLCNYIASLEIEFDSGSTTDTKLTLDYINFSYDSAVTEDSELEVKEIESSYCLVAFLGKTGHGLKIYEDTELGKYISLKSIISGSYLFDGVWSLDEDTGNPTKITNYPIKLTLEPIAENSDLLGAYFYTNMFTDGTFEKVIVYLFFCDEEDLPDDFFKSGEPEHVIPDGGSGDNSGDGSGDDESERHTADYLRVDVASGVSVMLLKVDESGTENYGTSSDDANILDRRASYESSEKSVSFTFSYVVDEDTYNGLKVGEKYTLYYLEMYNEAAGLSWTLTDAGDTNATSQAISNAENRTIQLTIESNGYDGNANPCVAFLLENNTGLKIHCVITFVTSSGSIVE